MGYFLLSADSPPGFTGFPRSSGFVQSDDSSSDEGVQPQPAGVSEADLGRVVGIAATPDGVAEAALVRGESPGDFTTDEDEGVSAPQAMGYFLLSADSPHDLTHFPGSRMVFPNGGSLSDEGVPPLPAGVSEFVIDLQQQRAADLGRVVGIAETPDEVAEVALVRGDLPGEDGLPHSNSSEEGDDAVSPPADGYFSPSADGSPGDEAPFLNSIWDCSTAGEVGNVTSPDGVVFLTSADGSPDLTHFPGSRGVFQSDGSLSDEGVSPPPAGVSEFVIDLQQQRAADLGRVVGIAATPDEVAEVALVRGDLPGEDGLPPPLNSDDE
jgi:hypothetical protein